MPIARSLSSTSSAPARFPPRWRRRLRSWLRRSSFAWWAAATVLALATGGVVRAGVTRSSAMLDELGPLRPVVVVVHDVEVGAVVGDGDVAVRRRPSAMVPDGALPGRAAAAVGRVAVVPLEPGEVVLAAKLAPDGLRGAAALLPDGMRAIAVPAGPGGRPPLSIGDRVDVLATVGLADASAAPTVVVAAGAVVVALDDESDAVTVAVPADEAPTVASAITTGTITLALTSPSNPIVDGTERVRSGRGPGR